MRQGAAVVVVGFFVAAAFWPAPERHSSAERFTGTSLNAQDQRTGTVEFVIERRSTDGERQQLLDTLRQERPEKLLDTIQTLPRVGYMLGDMGLVSDLHYAYGVKGDDGSERVILATDRPVALHEPGNGSLSNGHPFTLIELRVNEDGEARGKLSLVSRITKDESTPAMTLEDYDVQPLLLLSVRRETTKR
jgi:hypothetical protein